MRGITLYEAVVAKDADTDAPLPFNANDAVRAYEDEMVVVDPGAQEADNAYEDETTVITFPAYDPEPAAIHSFLPFDVRATVAFEVVKIIDENPSIVSEPDGTIITGQLLFVPTRTRYD